MKLNKIWIVTLFIYGANLFGDDTYLYVDIEECILPISKQLVKIDENNFIENNYKMTIKYPMAVTIDNKADITKKTYKKVVSMLKLNHKISIVGYEGLEGKGLNNNNILIHLKDHMILFANYPSNDLEYMLEYCKRTSKQ